jgi:hypothetical protein
LYKAQLLLNYPSILEPQIEHQKKLKLENLTLRGRFVVGRDRSTGADFITNFISSAQNLQILCLSVECLCVEDYKKIFQSLHNLLEVSINCRINPDLIFGINDVVPILCANNSSLQYLYLKGGALFHELESVATHSNLKHLELFQVPLGTIELTRVANYRQEKASAGEINNELLLDIHPATEIPENLVQRLALAKVKVEHKQRRHEF